MANRSAFVQDLDASGFEGVNMLLRLRTRPFDDLDPG